MNYLPAQESLATEVNRIDDDLQITELERKLFSLEKTRSLGHGKVAASSLTPFITIEVKCKCFFLRLLLNIMRKIIGNDLNPISALNGSDHAFSVGGSNPNIHVDS